MALDNTMDVPKVQVVISCKPVSAQAAHDLLSRFLEAERQDALAEVEDDELLVRLEHVCASLPIAAAAPSDEPKKGKKKSAKKERKEKRKREKESAKKSKKSKTT